jgi:uncharacterized protein (UPF0276 family)
MIPIGFSLQPDERFTELLEGLLRSSIDYYEVAPETLWRLDPSGAFVPNGFHDRFAELGRRDDKAFVAHGVGFSMASAGHGDEARRSAWLQRIARDQHTFRFQWYTDHLGATALGGLQMTLPIALPMTAHSAALVRTSLALLQTIVPEVGIENSVSYFTLGSPLEEPRFLARILCAPRMHLLLDLHNVYTMSQNFGFEAEAYLARLDLSKVIEIHLSGGSASEPGWIPSGRALRLDAHDGAIPERVWKLFELVAPRCSSLRGVTIERMEGTVESGDVPLLFEEVRRARRIVRNLS